MFYNWFLWPIILVIYPREAMGADDSYNTIHRDGSYEFGYNNPDSYHYADANRNNVVKGEFGGRNPGTGAFDTTVYTAGPRGFRPRGKNVARKYDLNQAGPRPVGSPDDPYYDPYEDPSYNFAFKTRTYTRQENANKVGDVNGKYSYVDDVGERHNVEFVAGKNTGFHVKTPFPDSNPRAYGPLYFNGRGKPIPRGRTSIQRGLDGSYRFVSAGPDQRRTETSDATGHVRGSYTYLDDKGVQHSVHYIAGPETGYRVLKTVKGPHLPTVFPFGRPEIIPPDFYDFGKDTDLFDTAASGHVKPGGGKPSTTVFGGSKDDDEFGKDKDRDQFNFGNKRPVAPSRKPPTPVFGDASNADFGGPSDANEDADDFGDLFGGGGTGGGGSTASPGNLFGNKGPGGSGSTTGPGNLFGNRGPGGSGSTSSPGSGVGSGSSSTTVRPTKPTVVHSKPDISSAEDDGSYNPAAGEDGSYKPYKPTRPSFGNLPRPGGLGNIPSTSGSPTGPSSRPTASKPSGGDSNEVDDNDFSLFGSETGNVRPPFAGRPVIHLGATDESCKKCAGTIVTNVGDKLFTVPPGVSVRAHVQAIDLIPISPSVPSPSEQYKVDTSIRTEQLNEASNQIISTNSTESNSEENVTDAIITTTLVPNT